MRCASLAGRLPAGHAEPSRSRDASRRDPVSHSKRPMRDAISYSSWSDFVVAQNTKLSTGTIGFDVSGPEVDAHQAQVV